MSWTAVASTAGTLSIEGSDDETNVTATVLTVDKARGVFPSVNASAGNCTVILENCPGWIRLKYTHSAGGGAAQFNAFITVKE